MKRRMFIRYRDTRIAARHATPRDRKLAGAYQDAGSKAVTHAHYHAAGQWPAISGMDAIYTLDGTDYAVKLRITIHPCQETHHDDL